jgi:2-methylcitrate dehydratase PrpD
MKDIMKNDKTRNADAVVAFIQSAPTRELPPDVLNAARFGVVDWFGVSLGAADQQAIHALKRVVKGWHAQGSAQILLGETTTAAAAALVNGTMAHCLDFDDTHVGSLAHLSGPTLAAALAAGNECGATASEIMRAFVTGFEVSGRLGKGGLGVAIDGRHIHSTGVFGCLGAAAAAAVLYQLDDLGIRRAMGLAATQVAGLTGSFGTPGKPFHAGKAGMNGVLAAQMAREGFHGGMDLLESGGGLDAALVQDGSVQVAALDFSDGWEITRNTFKPYASCLLTHPVIDAARELKGKLQGRALSNIRIFVHPLAIQLAGKPKPTTPFEGKFSLAFCSALALRGRLATHTDFTPETIADSALQSLVAKAELVPVADMEVTAAELELQIEDGETLHARTPLALGNPGRPMSWDDMRNKFVGLTSPALGEQSEQLFSRLREFDQQDDLGALLRMVART